MRKLLLAIALLGVISSPASADIIESFQFGGNVTYQWSPYVSPNGYVSGTMIFSSAGSNVAPTAVYVNDVEGYFTFAPPSDLNFATNGPNSVSYGSFDITTSGQVLSAEFTSEVAFPPAGEANFELNLTDTYTALDGATSFTTEYRITTANGLADVQFTVPEPASIVVFGCGLIAMILLKRGFREAV